MENNTAFLDFCEYLHQMVDQVRDIRHSASTRKGIPAAGLAAQGKLPKEQKITYAYNPHLPPKLVFDQTGRADRLNELLAKLGADTLTPTEIDELRALAKADPWLEWSGKREEQACVVDPVALNIHERVSAQAIIRMAAREDVQKSLFADPQEDLGDALKFYEHDVDWSNRMILGDSLAVMASLSRREGLAGKVQMIYCDFPYGIKYASNFQAEVGKKDVKDRPDDLTREPEMVKAYRDTWTLGIHSYLEYVRGRLHLMKELLADAGSVFVQISDENEHRVRTLLDEVFGAANFVSEISFVKTTGFSTSTLPNVADYILWYAKDKSKVKFRQPYATKAVGGAGADEYTMAMLRDGSSGLISKLSKDIAESDIRAFRIDNLRSQGGSEVGATDITFEGVQYECGQNMHWKTNGVGLLRLEKSGRLSGRGEGKTLCYIRYVDDFAAFPISNIWTDAASGDNQTLQKLYVVQTLPKVIERCMQMTTDPGDLVIDPTLGGGTTAYVAEKWARRWIGIDVSRVALAIARQRLLTAKFDYYRLRPTSASDISRNSIGPWLHDPNSDILGTCSFECKTVPHVTLKSIAQNQALDSIFDKWTPIIDQKLDALNDALRASCSVQLSMKLLLKAQALLSAPQRKKIGDDAKKPALSETDYRRLILPPHNRPDSPYTTVSNDFDGWYEWEVPYDADDDYPAPLKDALVDYRKAWRQRQDEVNSAIQARAEQEELVDQPTVVKGITRVSGPFTVEGVIPIEESIDLEEPSPIAEFDGELETFGDDDLPLPQSEPINAEAYIDQMLRLLKADGVRFPNNRIVKFERLEVSDIDGLHAEGEWEIDGAAQRVAVVFGPQYGPLNDPIIHDGMFAAASVGCKDVVFAAFSFDGAAQATIQQNPNPRLKLHMAQIRPDVNMGDLLKTTVNSQIFTVSGTPRVGLREVEGGEFEIEIQGVDIYDPITNGIRSSGGDKVAAWFLDRDYDGRTFCITQAFFPDKKAWDKLAKALGGKVDPDVFEKFGGTVSLPFKPGRQIAVKVIDPRGNEVMWVKRLGGGQK